MFRKHWIQLQPVNKHLQEEKIVNRIKKLSQDFRWGINQFVWMAFELPDIKSPRPSILTVNTPHENPNLVFRDALESAMLELSLSVRTWKRSSLYKLFTSISQGKSPLENLLVTINRCRLITDVGIFDLSKILKKQKSLKKMNLNFAS